MGQAFVGVVVPSQGPATTGPRKKVETVFREEASWIHFLLSKVSQPAPPWTMYHQRTVPLRIFWFVWVEQTQIGSRTRETTGAVATESLLATVAKIRASL
jgi:hypothetical protein